MDDMSDDLITWLRAQLDEDEAWAVAASTPPSHWVNAGPVPGGVHWVWGMGGNWEHYQPDPLEEFLGQNWTSRDDEGGGPTLVTSEEFETTSVGPLAIAVISYAEEVRTVDAAHIARHDPARILAEVQTKRRILDEIENAFGHCGGVGGDIDDDILCSPADPDRIVQLLALPYADRPGYRSEWAPPNG